ncbi:MAG TPA: spermidine/putrescine ABC transporter permease PotC [Oceanospirillaceae bacterium]|nr:spermidine/putrescine ABC transporter permease PotC [Oceanospirillaceae bacterium]
MRLFKLHLGWALLALIAGCVLLFMYLPMFAIVGYSFNSNPIDMMVWENFSFTWYSTIFGIEELNSGASYEESPKQLLKALKNSLIVAAFTTVIATFIGTITAIGLARYNIRFRKVYDTSLFLPMMMPDILLGISLLIFFVEFGKTLGMVTVIIGHCTFLVSYVFIIVQSRMATLDPALEEASSDLGASEWQTLRKVILPQLAPGIIGGALLSFIISMDDLVVTYFVSGTNSTTLPVYILSMMRRGVKPEINAIATLVMLSSFLIAALGLWLRNKKAS